MPDILGSALRQQLEDARKKKGLAVAELASIVQVRRTGMYDILQGRTPPTQEVAGRLSAALGVEVPLTGLKEKGRRTPQKKSSEQDDAQSVDALMRLIRRVGPQRARDAFEAAMVAVMVGGRL